MNFLRKRIPVILGLLLLLAGVAGGVYFFFTEPTAPPQNIRVTNITDQSLTISWITEKPTWGFVFFAPQDHSWKLKIPYFNRFLTTISPDDHLLKLDVHHVTLKNLQPETEYHYLISTGLRTYKGGIAKTTNALENPSFPSPIYGSIKTENKISPAYPAIVYLTLNNQGVRSALLSTLTNPDGNWSFDLANTRTVDLKSAFTFFDNNLRENVFVQAGKLGTYERIVFPWQDSPAPTMILKK